MRRRGVVLPEFRVAWHSDLARALTFRQRCFPDGEVGLLSVLLSHL